MMLHLRDLGHLHLDVLTVTGARLGEVLTWWEGSERQGRLCEQLQRKDGVNPDDVIMPPHRARARGLTGTAVFPKGNLAPDGSAIKSTALDPSIMNNDGVYRKLGRARVFTRERDAMRAIKSQGPDRVVPGDVVVLICGGPFGTGM